MRAREPGPWLVVRRIGQAWVPAAGHTMTRPDAEQVGDQHQADGYEVMLVDLDAVAVATMLGAPPAAQPRGQVLRDQITQSAARARARRAAASA